MYALTCRLYVAAIMSHEGHEEHVIAHPTHPHTDALARAAAVVGGSVDE